MALTLNSKAYRVDEEAVLFKAKKRKYPAEILCLG